MGLSICLVMDKKTLKLSVIHGNIQNQTARLEMQTGVEKVEATVPSLVIITCNTWFILKDKIIHP